MSIEPEKQPYEIVPDETPGEAEDIPVIRLEKSQPGLRKLPNPQEKKGIPLGRREQLPRSVEAIPAPFTERPAFNSGGIETVWGSQHEKRRPLPWLRISIFSLLVVALIIGGLGLYYRPEEKAEPVTHTKLDPAASPPAPVKTEATEADAIEMVKKMETSVRRYCAAQTVEERLKYVRQPERVKILMQAYYPDGKVPALTIRNIQFDPLTMENRADFWLASGETLSEGTKNFILELPEKGHALIDWEVDVLYQSYDWNRFAHEPPNGESHEFRVQVVPGVLFSHEFSDEGKWHCYVLSAPNSEEPLFGYCEVDSPSDRKLMDLLRRNSNQSVPMILQLKRPTGTLSPQGAIIESVISESWIYIGPEHPGS